MLSLFRKRNALVILLVSLPSCFTFSYPTTWHTSGKTGLGVSTGLNTKKNRKQVGTAYLTRYFSRNFYLKGGLSLLKHKPKRALAMQNARFLGYLSGCYTFYDWSERLFFNSCFGVLAGEATIDIMLGTEAELVVLPFLALELGLLGYVPFWKQDEDTSRFVPFFGVQMGIKVTF